uniref:Uncharacterized protein n=1 Tax=Oryza rufipogon TaxID=4529 RepID=A0A0E0QZT8_ORYRU
MPRENEMGRLGLGFIDGGEAGGQGRKDRELADMGANDQAATGHGGGGQGKKQKREGKRELCSLPIWASRGRRESA